MCTIWCNWYGFGWQHHVDLLDDEYRDHQHGWSRDSYWEWQNADRLSLHCGLKFPAEIYLFVKLLILRNVSTYYFAVMVAWVMNILLRSSWQKDAVLFVLNVHITSKYVLCIWIVRFIYYVYYETLPYIMEKGAWLFRSGTEDSVQSDFIPCNS